VSVVAFSRSARLVVDGRAAQRRMNPCERSWIKSGGGTNLEEAMRLAYETALRHFIPGGINRIILNRWRCNLGDVNPESLKKMVTSHRHKGIALDCFGIGWEGYNDELLEILSRNGDGRYGFMNEPEQAPIDFAQQLAGALSVAASDVKVQVEFNPDRVISYRQIGYAKHQLTKEQFRNNMVDAAEIAAEESGNALYLIEVISKVQAI
jgi:secreted protein with Ig-like and vWFA domain